MVSDGYVSMMFLTLYKQMNYDTRSQTVDLKKNLIMKWAKINVKNRRKYTMITYYLN